jgi:hypothetical protein
VANTKNFIVDDLVLASGVGSDPDTASLGAPKLILTGADGTVGATLTGQGKVKAGGTTITGGGSSGLWRTVGDDTTIEITADNITGVGTDAKLAGVTADAATIAVAAAEDSAATLTVTSATIDISGNGTVTLTGNGDGDAVSATLVLKGATATATLLLVATNTTPVATIGNVGLNINESGSAEIKFKGDPIVTTTLTDLGFTATLHVASGGANVGTAQFAGKLVGGTAGGDDLSIVSAASATATSITKASKLVAKV